MTAKASDLLNARVVERLTEDQKTLGNLWVELALSLEGRTIDDLPSGDDLDD